MATALHLLTICLCMASLVTSQSDTYKEMKPYPQYEYKPYTSDCNQRQYSTFAEYVTYFHKEWYNYEEFPYYRMNETEKRYWDSYGQYETDPYDIKPTEPGSGVCCYHYKEGPSPRIAPKPNSVKVRQEYRTLSNSQRNSLHNAFQSLYASGGLDLFVNQHRGWNAPNAHGGAAFLPWHREFLWRLENALEKHGYKGGLPYFDSTLDVGLPVPAHSAVWTKKYLGNINGAVTIGFAANWNVIPACQPIGSTLTRNGIDGSAGQCYLFSDFDISYVFSKRCFRDIVCMIDCKFEQDHAAVHNFVGGHMGSPNCAPSDPFFFMHHAFVDCIWEEFRQNHQQSVLDREYPAIINGDNIGGPGNEYFAPMNPFAFLVNGHGIQHFYESYYKCAGRPFRCDIDSDCKSPILWCFNNRCMAKIKKGGKCGNLPNNACDGPCGGGKIAACVKGRCKCIYPPIVAAA